MRKGGNIFSSIDGRLSGIHALHSSSAPSKFSEFSKDQSVLAPILPKPQLLQRSKCVITGASITPVATTRTNTVNTATEFTSNSCASNSHTNTTNPATTSHFDLHANLDHIICTKCVRIVNISKPGIRIGHANGTKAAIHMHDGSVREGGDGFVHVPVHEARFIHDTCFRMGFDNIIMIRI